MHISITLIINIIFNKLLMRKLLITLIIIIILYSKLKMREVIFHDDLFPKLIEYLEPPHAALFLRINTM